jgi:hypothetical protein
MDCSVNILYDMMMARPAETCSVGYFVNNKHLVATDGFLNVVYMLSHGMFIIAEPSGRAA